MVNDHNLNQNKSESTINQSSQIELDENLKTEPVKEFNQKIQLSSLIKNLTKKIDHPKKETVSSNSKDLEDQEKSKRIYDRPFRPKIDITNVDIYDFEPIKKNYSKNRLVFNLNYLEKETEFRFSDQWANWIERDISCANSPLAQLFKEQRMAVNPLIHQAYAMKSGKNVQASEEVQKEVYSPLRNLNQIEEELKECRDEEFAKMNRLDQDMIRNKGLNLKPLFENQFMKQQSSKEEHLSDHELDEDQVIKKNQLKISEITALDYLRRIKNKEIDVQNVKLKEVIDKKIDNKDNVTFKREKLEYDSKGFKNYKNQVFNFYALNNPDRALFLESEIIFNNLGIVAVNKPYGLICPGDKEISFGDKNKKPVELISFLRDFAYLVAMQDKKDGKENTFEDLNNPILYPIYKLDRNCTGVYILAKNKETTKIVHKLFKERQVKLFYDAITKNVPKLDKASIDIPIEQDHKDTKYGRMLLRPDVQGDYKVLVKASKRADKAITNYKVLKTHKNAAYLELNPLTSVKHQLRVHLGIGLRTPILGDHLYDNAHKIDYQKLPLDMLLNLNVRPTKTMHLPMHLHCKLIILNQFGRNGKDIFLKADLPNFFKENLKSLKLN